jgi:hypothetical protein
MEWIRWMVEGGCIPAGNGEPGIRGQAARSVIMVRPGGGPTPPAWSPNVMESLEAKRAEPSLWASVGVLPISTGVVQNWHSAGVQPARRAAGVLIDVESAAALFRGICGVTAKRWRRPGAVTAAMQLPPRVGELLLEMLSDLDEAGMRAMCWMARRS